MFKTVLCTLMVAGGAASEIVCQGSRAFSAVLDWIFRAKTLAWGLGPSDGLGFPAHWKYVQCSLWWVQTMPRI